MISVRRCAWVLAGLVIGSAAQAAAPVRYPETKKLDLVETLHGVQVPDPYRWLEDLDSTETAAWVKAQNEAAFGYLAKIPFRDGVKARVTELWNFERYSLPNEEGGRYFYSYNNGLQNQSVLYVTSSLSEQGRVLLDPNTYRADGTVALSGTFPTRDGRLLGYSISDAGSDWVTLRVRDAQTGRDLPDEIKWVKFSGMSWLPDGSGFFYGRYQEPTADNPLSALNEDRKIYFHKLGTPQSADQLVYERPDAPRWGFGAGVSDDGSFLIMTITEGTERKNRLFYRDLRSRPLGSPDGPESRAIRALDAQKGKELRAISDAAAQRAARQEWLGQRNQRVRDGAVAPWGFVELIQDADAAYSFVGSIGDTLLVETNLDAPLGRLVAIDLKNPDRANWKTVIAQSDATLQGVSHVGGRLIASYLRDASSEVKVFETDGALVRTVDLPGIGTAGGFGGRPEDTETFYSFTSYAIPTTIYRYDIATGASEVFKSPAVPLDTARYKTERVFVTSKDGARVPVFVASAKDVQLDGSNPTLLYGYGGFNISQTPAFSPAFAAWMDMGGVVAVACLRGGGEYGKPWHDAGKLANKQNVFDDFIAAGEWLVRSRYTSPARLAIQGGSNGGLLVGAAMTQRPDLFGVALPAVGVMDMLRFHLFTIGWGWKSDYGDPEIAADFKTAYAYSPYHALLRATPGTRYPSTLVTTGDHDDRVVPSHSFKFASALQAAHGGDNPVLIRIETRAGHGAGKPTTKRIEEVADIFSFAFHEMGFTPRLSPQRSAR